jgi:hypothetical protein
MLTSSRQFNCLLLDASNSILVFLNILMSCMCVQFTSGIPFPGGIIPEEEGDKE